jgi:glycerophosphoryl diester phosphodiesterase
MVRIIAHRGSSRVYPENSLAAFLQAVTSGADALEVDLRRSADGVIYCFHDSRLGRLTGHSGYVQRTSSKQIDRLKLRGSEPTLRFDHFLEEFAGKVEIVLDIKSIGIERDILNLVSRMPRRSGIMFSSFNSRILSRIKSLSPPSRTALIVGPVRNLRVKLDIGSYLVNRLTKLNCAAAHLSERIARPGVVRKLLGAGFAVAVWTIDDTRTALRFAGLGANGIISNVPEELVTIRSRLNAAAK